MGTLGMALVLGGMALLFSGLIVLIPVRGKRHPPRESFEDSQRRMERYLQEMRRGRGENLNAGTQGIGNYDDGASLR